MKSLSKRERLRAIARMLWVILLLNGVVAVAKLGFGSWSRSLAITTDGLNSLLDAAANVLGLIGIKVARRPPDANHPYGHRKYETFAALAIAGVLLLGCREIVVAAIARLRHPVPVTISWVLFVVMIATLALNLLVVTLERRAGERLGSELLIADAAHTMTDVFTTVLVLVSLVAQRFGMGWADVAATGVIVLFIARAVVSILRNTLSTLSDERRIEPRSVEHVALQVPGVREAHNVRSRGAQDDIHLDLHILVDPEIKLLDAHGIAHNVEHRLRAVFEGVTDVVVHVEPELESERATRREGGGLRAKS
jgi:cation diffusion facilitator family transporter